MTEDAYAPITMHKNTCVQWLICSGPQYYEIREWNKSEIFYISWFAKGFLTETPTYLTYKNSFTEATDFIKEHSTQKTKEQSQGMPNSHTFPAEKHGDYADTEE